MEEYVEAITLLGYRCSAAAGPLAALRAVTEDAGIEILIVDIELPDMDGITFLEELSSRFAPLRPMVALVITGQPTLESAIKAMRSNAIDFLAKPVALEDLAAALRRAATRLYYATTNSWLHALSQSTECDGPPKPSAIEAGEGANADVAPSNAKLQALVRSIKYSREARSQFLDRKLFSDPGWDMLLELTSAALEGTPIPTSSVCAATDAPFSTALRYTRQLVDAGLVRSWLDPADKRRTMLELDPVTFGLMKDYLISISLRRNAVLATKL